MKHAFLLAAMLVTSAPAVAQTLVGAGTPSGNTAVPVQIAASQGIDWSQKTHTVTAIGNAKVVRGDVTITADELIAHYAPQKTKSSTSDGADDLPVQGNAQLTELEAVGHVHIYTATDNAWGDHAVYSIGQQVLVLTGKHLKLTTAKDTVTARDSIEYYVGQHKAIARGDAHINAADGRSITADVIIGYFSTTPAQGADGSLEKVDAFGHVMITTQAETASGHSGVYLPATGEARLGGNVHITHGGNQMSGADALINTKTGTATLLSAPGKQVSGVILPNTEKN